MAATANRAARRRRGRRMPWDRWSRGRLLDTRLCDLGLTIEGTWLAEVTERVVEEIAERGLNVRPHFWLSDEWFSPSGVPGVALPFYLAHPRLMRLERSRMLEVEGGTRESCLKLLRHEVGHAVQHAYGLHRRKRWQRVFGASSAPYPDYYRPNPASKHYVQHLDAWYAQSHPDEDFAETFALWLQPGSRWRKRYRGWPALKKLVYVDELMEELRGRAPAVRSKATVDPLPRLKKTLREHYVAKRERYAVGYTDRWDADLLRLFPSASGTRRGESAVAFLRRNRREIRELVSRWTGEYAFTIDQVLKQLIGRCRELRLRRIGPERQVKLDFAIMLTVQAMHYLYRRREWHTL